MKKIGKMQAIMAALNEINTNEIQDNEFTVFDFIETAKQNGKIINIKTARDNLQRMAVSGKLKKRTAIINSKLTNVYSAP